MLSALRLCQLIKHKTIRKAHFIRPPNLHDIQQNIAANFGKPQDIAKKIDPTGKPAHTPAMDPSNSSMDITALVISLVVVLVMFIVYIWSLVWLYRDANRRNSNGLVITILVAIFAWPIGLLIWLLARPRR